MSKYLDFHDQLDTRPGGIVQFAVQLQRILEERGLAISLSAVPFPPT
jgi:hypothetical protein